MTIEISLIVLREVDVEGWAVGVNGDVDTWELVEADIVVADSGYDGHHVA